MLAMRTFFSQFKWLRVIHISDPGAAKIAYYCLIRSHSIPTSITQTLVVVFFFGGQVEMEAVATAAVAETTAEVGSCNFMPGGRWARINGVCVHLSIFPNRTCSWHSKHFLINGRNSIIARINLLLFHMNYLSNYQIIFGSCTPAHTHNAISHRHFHLFNVIAHIILWLRSIWNWWASDGVCVCVRTASTIYHKTITRYCHCMSQREICWAIKWMALLIVRRHTHRHTLADT